MNKFIELFKAQYSWKNLYNHSRMLGTALASGLYSIMLVSGVTDNSVSLFAVFSLGFLISFVVFFLSYEVFKFVTLLAVLPLVIWIDSNLEDSDLYEAWLKRVKK